MCKDSGEVTVAQLSYMTTISFDRKTKLQLRT